MYVYHQDGRTEDLTAVQALARPELADSGRLFPEKLARQIADAYRYPNADGTATQGSDPPDRTVVPDARERRIVRVFDHADPKADGALRAFFRGR